TRSKRDWSSDVCSSDLSAAARASSNVFGWSTTISSCRWAGRLTICPRLRVVASGPSGSPEKPSSSSDVSENPRKVMNRCNALTSAPPSNPPALARARTGGVDSPSSLDWHPAHIHSPVSRICGERPPPQTLGPLCSRPEDGAPDPDDGSSLFDRNFKIVGHAHRQVRQRRRHTGLRHVVAQLAQPAEDRPGPPRIICLRGDRHQADHPQRG